MNQISNVLSNMDYMKEVIVFCLMLGRKGDPEEILVWYENLSEA